MQRRQFLAGAATLVLAGCDGTDAPTTIGNIVDEIKKQCSFAPDLEAIVAVITTIVSGFNAAAGAATVVAAAIGKQIVDMVCGAVKAQVAQISTEKKALPNKMTVKVNGVDVSGKYGVTN